MFISRINTLVDTSLCTKYWLCANIRRADMPMREELFERAVTAYARALWALDPVRFKLWTDRKLTMPQVRILFLLVEQGDQSAGELAEYLSVSPSTITGITDRLTRQGLIERRDDPRDRRLVRLCLTPEGRGLTMEIADSSRAVLRRIFERMGAARAEALAQCLEEFAAANEGAQTVAVEA
jgi:DNA-binding MarR family transcriptional regulator